MVELPIPQNQPDDPPTWHPDPDRLTLMQHRISDPPRILTRSAGRSSCSIFTVPTTLAAANDGRAYRPQIVSVGPYHHGDPGLRMIQEHKWRLLGALLDRARVGLEDLLRAVQPLEAQARDCYSAAVHVSADEFVEMLVVDGCFVVELLRIFGGFVGSDAGDPLTSLSWVYPFFLRDLVRLENQIPFFVLECLVEATRVKGVGSDPGLPELVLRFFNNALQRPDEFVERSRNLTGKHLLDFLRLSLIPEGYDEPEHSRYTNTHVIPCISKLVRAGIKLRPGPKHESFLAVKFKRGGVIEMPTITIDDFMCTFLLNCVAYEQCHKHCSKHVTTYATFLDCLVNTARDVEHLCDRNIIENYMGTDADVATFVNNLGRDVSFYIDACYLSGLFNEVNDYYNNHWHVQWASFKYTYFNTPWSFISALAAFVLLVLTVAQTYFTIMGYVRPPN